MTYPNFEPYDVIQRLAGGIGLDLEWQDFSTIRTAEEADYARRIVDSRGASSGFAEAAFRIVGGMPQKVKYSQHVRSTTVL